MYHMIVYNVGRHSIIRLAILLTLFVPIIVGSVGAYAAEENASTAGESLKYMAMAIAVGIGTIGGGYAVAKVGVAACAAAAEKPELVGRLLIYLGLAEGVCIYGTLIALLIWIG